MRKHGARKFVAEDADVGRAIRTERKRLGITQETLAAELGISHQQLQRFETGDNRISAGKLWHCARALGVPVLRFYAEIEARHG